MSNARTAAPVEPKPNRTLRTVLITVGAVAVSALLVGLTLQGARVAASASQDFSGTYTLAETFDSISIETVATDVSIEYRDVDRAALVFDQRDLNLRFSQQIQNSTLTVIVEEGSRWNPWTWTPSLTHPKLQLVLPESFRDSGLRVDIETTAGDLDIDGDFSVIDLTTTAGDVRVSGTADALRFNGTAGDLDLDNFATDGDISANLTAGDATLTLASLPASISLESTAGDMTVTLPSGAYKINAKTTLGDVSQQATSSPTADRVYDFRSTVGDISIRQR